MSLNRDPDADPALLELLSRAGIDDPRRDLRKLWRWVLDTHGTERVADAPMRTAVDALHRAARQRADGMPVSKIMGQREFWKRAFRVTADVLDPRPDTETLVEQALGRAFDSVLDLGTGSGCILISLLDERPDALGLGVDLSEAALTVARENAVGMPNARFARSDWFAHVQGRFDLIVSNPPYIAAHDMEGLAREVRDHDPRMALTDERDGLEAYRIIASQAQAYLMPQGWCLVEIGASQRKDVMALFAAAGWDDISCHRDLAGKDRVICAQNPAR